MDPEYYGCLYKRYNTYVRDYNSNNKIKRIACGPNVDDYHWTREVMDKVKHHAQGISLHYYTIPVIHGSIKALQQSLILRNIIKLLQRLTELKNL